MTAPDTPPGPRPYHRGNVRDDLLTAARRILKTERYEDVSIRRLTRELGVTPGNFYNHFESMDDLLLTLGGMALDRRNTLARKLMREATSRPRLIIEWSLDFVEAAVREPQLFRVMFGQVAGANDHPIFRPAIDRGFRLLVEAVYGEDRHRPDDPAWSQANCAHAYALFSLQYGLTRNILETHFAVTGKAGRRALVERTIQLFVDGGCAAPFQIPVQTEPRGGRRKATRPRETTQADIPSEA